MFRNVQDEVAFTKFLDSKSRSLDNEDNIMLSFLQSRSPSELHALYEKQTLKSWQINVAIEHGKALESLYRHNKLSSGSIDRATNKGQSLLYLYKYQPNFKKKHLKDGILVLLFGSKKIADVARSIAEAVKVLRGSFSDEDKTNESNKQIASINCRSIIYPE